MPRRKSFTLIELLLSISIISILTLISVQSFRTAQIKSRDTVRKTHMAGIQNALEQYHAANATYAPNFAALGAGVIAAKYTSCGTVPGGDTTGLGECFYDLTANATYTNDLLFHTDSTSAQAIAASGYLIPYLATPEDVVTTVPDGLGHYPSGLQGVAGPSYSVPNINYKVQARYYMMRTILENKNASIAPSTTSCSSFSDPGYSQASTNAWRNATYSIDPTTCNNYKVYQVSSLSSL